MKRITLITFLSLIFVFSVHAQNTNVTATITDAGGQTWNNGTYTFNFIPKPQFNGSYRLSGAPYTPVPIPGSLSAIGAFTNVPVPDNNLITPSGTQWTVTVCAQTQFICFTSGFLTITGASQTITSSVIPPAISITCGPGAVAYTDTEVGCSVGGQYYNLVSQSNRVCQAVSGNTCTTWASVGGVTTTSSIPGEPGVTAVPVTSGLIGEFRMLPSENPCALVDYSGNANNATGCVGVSPAIIPVSGGISDAFNGGILLHSALNAAKTVQIFMHPVTSTSGLSGSPIFGNGGTLASVSGLLFVPSSTVQTINGPALPGYYRLLSTTGSDLQGVTVRAVFKGNVTVTWSMDTLDSLYFNNTLLTHSSVGNTGYYSQSRSMAGVQTSGVFQLGGVNAAHYGQPASLAQFSGFIYYAVFYNRVLTAAEVAANVAFINSAMAARGVTPSIFDPLVTSDSLVLDGDSQTSGCCTAPGTPYSLYTTFQPAGSWNVYNQGIGGAFIGYNGSNLTGLITGAPFAVDPLYAPAGSRNTVVIMAGVNDNGVTAESGLAGYCRARKAVGWKCLVATMMSHTGADAFKNTYDTWIRLNWHSFADGLIDVGSDPLLGADGAAANATWCDGTLHPLTQGYANLVAPIIQRGVNRFHGNNDFSTANVYVAAAPAAVAVSAATEAGNTATFTTAANAFAVGQCATVAGVTPAGYNSPAGHCWQILTAPNNTTFTAYLPVTGLGALSVAGTASVPQQQDVDTYAILNFGAGNFTLESCMGYTGQSIYIRNINAAPSTLVPFASETITPSATLAANTTAILQSQLVSSAAAGCNWVRLQ